MGSRRGGLAFFVALSFQSAALADQTDEYVMAAMREQKIPGVSLAVARAGDIVKIKGYGLANVELDVPVKPETMFQSGSVGKQFTATLVMMLVEEGRLKLDTKISDYLADTPPSWKDVTIRHLLTHTSGLGDIYTVINMRHDYTEDELLKAAESVPTEFLPGEKWKYSNTGYLTLGIIIHRVMGTFYGDLLRERIFEPLGMTTARIISETDIVPNRAAGYQFVKGKLKNQDWVAPALNTTADGSLYVSALDMAKWDAALYTEKLLKKTSLAQMWTQATLNDGTRTDYGFGWGLGYSDGHKVIQHGGSWQGFRTNISRYVDDKVTVIVLCNLAEADPDKIAHGVAALYLSTPGK
jgi:CubicO group peptidase (beta-lactamase class C family)